MRLVEYWLIKKPCSKRNTRCADRSWVLFQPSFRRRGGRKYPIGEQFRGSVERHLYRNRVLALSAEDEGILIPPRIADTQGIRFHPEIIRFRILLAERAETHV